MTKHGEKRVIAYLLIMSGAALAVLSLVVKSSAVAWMDLSAGLVFLASGFWMWRRNFRRRRRWTVLD